MRLSAHDYISLMERLALFSDGSPVPECNSAAWRLYLNLYAQHVGQVDDIDIIATPSGAGFYRDPLAGAENWSWALLGPISHPPVPFTAGQLIAMAPDILACFADDGIAAPVIMTDSFQFSAPPGPTEERYFTWLNSPRARIHADVELYASSLAAKRRKQMRRLQREYEENQDFDFAFSATGPDARELDFIVDNTRARWQDDSGYALVQTLWPVAVAQVLPQAAAFMRVRRGGHLVLFNSYLIRDRVIYSQATCRKEGDLCPGLGTFVDFKAIANLCGNAAIDVLDPTCRATLDDPPSIGIAKREVVNEDWRQPLFALNAGSAPDFTVAHGWQLPDALRVEGALL